MVDVSVQGDQVVFEVEGSTAIRVGYRSNACAMARNVRNAGERPAAISPAPYDSLLSELSDCRALIFKTLDAVVTRALEAGEITAYVCSGNSVDQAAELFARGRLEKVKDEGAGTER